MVNVSSEENKLNFICRIFFRIHVEKKKTTTTNKMKPATFYLQPTAPLHLLIFLIQNFVSHRLTTIYLTLHIPVNVTSEK